jgi:hypothetical protein
VCVCLAGGEGVTQAFSVKSHLLEQAPSIQD